MRINLVILFLICLFTSDIHADTCSFEQDFGMTICPLYNKFILIEDVTDSRNGYFLQYFYYPVVIAKGDYILRGKKLHLFYDSFTPQAVIDSTMDSSHMDTLYIQLKDVLHKNIDPNLFFISFKDTKFNRQKFYPDPISGIVKIPYNRIFGNVLAVYHYRGMGQTYKPHRFSNEVVLMEWYNHPPEVRCVPKETYKLKKSKIIGPNKKTFKWLSRCSE